jgi:hypothetical protein
MAALAEVAMTEKTQVLITQCLVELFSTPIFRDKKNRRKVGDVADTFDPDYGL